MRWFHRLELKGYLVGDYRDMIMSWPARKAGQAIRVVIKTLPKNGLEEAIEKLLGRGFKRPHPEVACLLREVLDDNDVKSMGFDRIVVMHEPIANRYLVSPARFFILIKFSIIKSNKKNSLDKIKRVFLYLRFI